MDNTRYSANANVNGVEIKMALNTLAYFSVTAFMIDANNGTDVTLEVMVSSPIVATRAPLSTTSAAMENVTKMDESGFAPPAMDTATHIPRKTKIKPQPKALIVKLSTFCLSFERMEDASNAQNVAKIKLASAARHGENHMMYADRQSVERSKSHPIASRYLSSNDVDHQAFTRDASTKKHMTTMPAHAYRLRAIALR